MVDGSGQHERPLPRPGQIYWHVEDRLYEVVACPVRRAATDEQLVVYRALCGVHGEYACPLKAFMAPVDSARHPRAVERWRFTRVHLEGDD